VQPVEGFRGVFFDRDTGKFEAILALPEAAGNAVLQAQGLAPSSSPVNASGGEYDSAEDAARAYDSLARMYFGGDAETNFPLDAYAAFEPPRVEARPQRFETKRGEPLTAPEIVSALEAERAGQVVCLDVRGRADGFAWLIVASGRSPSHMRRLADMVFRGLLARRLRPPPSVGSWSVEGRDTDDWMIVDCGEIVVNVMSETARRTFNLEQQFVRGEADDESGGDDDEDNDAGWTAEDLERALGKEAAARILQQQLEVDSTDTDDASLAVDHVLQHPSRSAVRRAVDRAVASGASPSEATMDPITQWVAVNPVPEEWLSKSEADNATTVEDEPTEERAR
jgi:ribosome-associated protein